MLLSSEGCKFMSKKNWQARTIRRFISDRRGKMRTKKSHLSKLERKMKADIFDFSYFLFLYVFIWVINENCMKICSINNIILFMSIWTFQYSCNIPLLPCINIFLYGLFQLPIVLDYAKNEMMGKLIFYVFILMEFVDDGNYKFILCEVSFVQC